MAAWLLLRTDPEKSELCLGRGKSVCVRASDVAELLGVPGGGSQLILPNPVQHRVNRDLVANMLSDGYARHVVSLAKAHSVLLRTHDAEEMTTQMETAFLVALVLYAVGSLLAHRADISLEEVDPRVVASLIDPFAVGSYDWAQYTVDVLMESATGVTRNARASQGGTRVYVSGCTAFLNLFYLKNCTDLLQCRPSRRLGPYISLLHGGDLSNAEETSLLQQCLMVSHISHLAGSKVQGTCYDDEVNNEVPVSRGRSSVGGPIIPDNIKGMECGSGSFDVCSVQPPCAAMSSNPIYKAFDVYHSPMDPMISRGSCQRITAAQDEGSLLSNLCLRFGNVHVNSCDAYDCHMEPLPIRINFDSTPTFHCGDEPDPCASTPGIEQHYKNAGSEGEEVDMPVFDASPERDALSAGTRVVL